MKAHLDRGLAVELFAYALLTVALLAFTYYLYYWDPLTYVRLVAEDHLGEYATAISYFLAGVLVLALAVRAEPGVRRWVWAAIGLSALLIAGEEISWAQRILGIETPEAIREANRQGELTLHNLKAVAAVNDYLHEVTGVAMVGWLALSVLLPVWKPSLEQRMLAIGVPLIPIGLVPLFLPPAYFFLLEPVVRYTEVGEWTLALAVTAWAVRLFLANWPGGWSGASAAAGLIAPGATLAVFIAVAVLSATVTSAFPGGFWRIHPIAAQEYPDYGLYDQAEVLFDFIFANPEYVLSSTQRSYEEMRRRRAEEESASTED